MPLSLIDKQDNFEIIRDEIASILAVETDNQQAEAVIALKNPKLWEFKVYTERSRVWESLADEDPAIPVVPVVNVWFESEDFDGGQSFNTLHQVADEGIFNIDIFAGAVNVKNVGDGYQTSDRQAVLDAQRIVRLIRNIFFSVPADTTQPGDDYTYLNLRGIVGRRRIKAVTMFQPDDKKQAIAIASARISLGVKYSETGIEDADNALELLQTQTTTSDGGEVTLQFDLK